MKIGQESTTVEKTFTVLSIKPSHLGTSRKTKIVSMLPILFSVASTTNTKAKSTKITTTESNVKLKDMGRMTGPFFYLLQFVSQKNNTLIKFFFFFQRFFSY